MAINFLNSINLNQNELIKGRIENQPNNTAAGTGVEGQLYYDTTLDVLKVWANGAWTEVGGGVVSLSTVNSAFVDLANSGTASDPILTASLSATGAPSSLVYLRGDNAWEPISAIPGTYNFIFTGDTGTSTTIASGATAKVSGGTYISTSSAATGIVTITHDDTARVNNPISDAPALGASFVTAGSVATNATGHVTGVTLQTVTLPTTAVTQATGDNSTKIATTAFVQAAVTGLLEFKGGFNASTGAIASPGTGDLYTNVAISVGDYYVVTVAGDFFGNAATPLTPGDSVIVQTAAISGAAVEADFIVVQSDTDLATISTVGLGNVNAGAGIGVVYSNGTATVSTVTTSFADTVTDTATVTHSLNTLDVTVQLYDTVTKDTVYADVTRASVDTVTITFASTPTNSVRVLVQK